MKVVIDTNVVIASITSCTNTSNPSVMIGAALLAKKAVEKGLTSKPWVKPMLKYVLQGVRFQFSNGRLSVNYAVALLQNFVVPMRRSR